jgi:6-phosphogluconolactonase
MKLFKKLSLLLLLLPLWALPTVASASYFFNYTGAVFTTTNAVEGNEVLMFSRNAKGKLHLLNSFATGGEGTGSGLGNQGALILTRDHRWLFAVNAGSDEISVFKVRRSGLKLVDVVPSGGIQPVSLTVKGNLLYVLHAGSDSINGFRINRTGTLSALPGSDKPLSSVGVAPAQIAFSPWGDQLVVTEKATNLITVFPVEDNGLPGDPVLNPSEGLTPFGFSFDRRGHLLVSEAAGGASDASSASSYEVNEDGSLEVISGAVPTTETAACWLVVAPNSHVAFTTNTGSGSITALKISRRGHLELQQDDGVAAYTVEGSRPIDMAFSANGRFLYALSATGGSISAFKVKGRGELLPIRSLTGLVETVNGLAAY